MFSLELLLVRLQLLLGLKYKSKIFSLFFVILDLHDTVVLICYGIQLYTFSVGA
jgi:hypothetical protein